MSWVRIWTHLVFSTKEREPIFYSLELRDKIFKHIANNAKEKDIWIDTIGGYIDHVHCLVALNKDQSISKVAQLLKGESSYWINRNNLTRNKFHWQDDFWAVGVSESHLTSIREYILNQNEHHKVRSFNEEVKLFMNKYGWPIINGHII